MLLKILEKANLVADSQTHREIATSPSKIARLDIQSPETLCIYQSDHRDTTLEFFDLISRAVFEHHCYVSLDLSGLQRITAAAAVILFAHVTRAQNASPLELFRFRDRVIDIHFGDNKKMRDFFSSTGLYEALRPGGRKKLESLWDNPTTPFKTHNEPNRKHVEVAAWLRSYYGLLPKRMAAAVQEALLNITHHSYSLFKQGELPLDPFMVNRWWQYADFEESDDAFRLTFIIYDMGSGIPKLACEAANSNDDAGIIQEAMVRGFSSTGIPGRGNGSADMLKPIVLSEKEDSLYVYSGRGEVGYLHNSIKDSKTNLHSIGGTLLEWTFTSYEHVDTQR